MRKTLCKKEALKYLGVFLVILVCCVFFGSSIHAEAASQKTKALKEL